MDAVRDVQGYLETMRLLPKSLGGGEGNGAQSETQRVSVVLMLVAVGFMYSVHNLIAPNMTAIARLFHFDKYQRDTYVGGELTFFFYFPGVLGSIIAGILSGLVDRRMLLSVLTVMTAVTCLFTFRVVTWSGLVWVRALSGFLIGGSLPVVYSLVGDWFPAKRRSSATAFVSAASGVGLFFGQCIATLLGSGDWRWPFLFVAFPATAAGVAIWLFAEEPKRGGQEDGNETLALYQRSGLQYTPVFGYRHIRALLQNRTNMLVLLQAFPGNVPWGIIIIYSHDFLVEDLGLSRHSALGAIATMAGAAFVGTLFGGFIGEQLYGTNSRYLGLFSGICNIVRAIPFFILFGWTHLFGSFAQSSEGTFYLLLMVGGFTATMAGPCTGAMLLNVNLPEVRGSVMAIYTVLDDLSKGFGTFFVSMVVHLVGGRAVAYQIALFLWVGTGVALLWTWYTYDVDEREMQQMLEESAMEAMVHHSKQRAQEAIRDRAKAAGAAHFASVRCGARHERQSDLRWPSQSMASGASLSAIASSPGPSFQPRAGTNTAGCWAPGCNMQLERDRLRRAVKVAAGAAAAAAASERTV